MLNLKINIGINGSKRNDIDNESFKIVSIRLKFEMLLEQVSLVKYTKDFRRIKIKQNDYIRINASVEFIKIKKKSTEHDDYFTDILSLTYFIITMYTVVYSESEIYVYKDMSYM